MSSNPFAKPSTLPYQLPPFAQVTDDLYAGAFADAIAEHNAEIQAILASGEPTFENTLVAFEKSGQQLFRVMSVFYNKHSSDTNDTIDALDEEFSPKLTAHFDSITLNPEFFARIDALYQKRDSLTVNGQPLDEESLWLLERHHREFTLAGAALNEADREELKAINEELSLLETRFGKNALNEQNDLGILVEDVAELDGLGESEIAICAAAAAERGEEGKYLIKMINYTGHPFMASLTNRALRQRIQENVMSKGLRGNENDNRATLVEIVKLRAKRAQLLGFKNHAAEQTFDKTAGTPENVHAMFKKLAPSANVNVRKEGQVLQQQIAKTGGNFELQSWDWDFYAEQVRLEQYAVDTGAMQPYFELERTLNDGVFFAAGKLFGLTFELRADLEGWHPESRVWEVKNTDGSPVGLYVGDFFTRDSKRGGAWMSSFIDQSHLLGNLPVVYNNMNVPKPAGNEPALLTLDEVKTLFHEFGHALHGLLSNVQYPHFSGTSVARDFVEFPSQVNEMWGLWPEVVNNYARHYKTGEALPQQWIDNLERSLTFDQGHDTVALLAVGVIDMAWHELSVDEAEKLTAADVEAFEANALAAYGLDYAPVPTRYRSTYCTHIFAGGYSAGYYGYFWSEVLDADTVEWFKSNGGFKLENGTRFRERLLSRGGSNEAMAMYRDFRGADADINFLLKRRGLI